MPGIKQQLNEWEQIFINMRRVDTTSQTPKYQGVHPPPFFGALIFRQLEDGSCKHLNRLSKAVCYYQSKEHVSTVSPTVGMTTAKWMQITQTCNTFTFGKQRQKCMIYTHLHDCRSRPGLAHWADLVCDLYVHFWQLLGLFIVIWQILTLPHFLEFVIKNI